MTAAVRSPMTHGAPSSHGFVERLRAAVLPADCTELLVLANFEVEHEWAAGAVRLPRLSSDAGMAVVARMDEFGILLADSSSSVVVSSAPDPDLLEHLDSIGFDLPAIHVIDSADLRRPVTENAVADPAILDTLRSLAADGCALLPHGVSPSVEKLSAAAGMTVAGPSAAVCRAVNSKVYSRRLADNLGLRQPRGWACSSASELHDAVDAAADLLTDCAVVVKEAYGVSGKGAAVVTSERRLARLESLIVKRAAGTGEEISFCLEEWLDNIMDLNYHFTISRSGRIVFDGVKEAVTDNGVHRGHRLPARLTDGETAEIERCAHDIGTQLFRDGYFGIVGVDGLIDRRRRLYPLIEINARSNMSTYQIPAQEMLLPPGWVFSASQHPVRTYPRLTFAGLRDVLGDLLIARPGDTGAVVNNFATVNAAENMQQEGSETTGRLYTMSFGPTDQDVAGVDAAIADCLAELAAAS